MGVFNYLSRKSRIKIFMERANVMVIKAVLYTLFSGNLETYSVYSCAVIRLLSIFHAMVLKKDALRRRQKNK